MNNVPGLGALRQDLLPLAQRFASLPEDVKAKYEHPESYYAFGWSHGKERLQGRPDFSKGSFYANPQYDRPVDDAALIEKYAAFVHPNIWPEEELPELAPAFKAAGRRIVHVGSLLARHADRFVHARLPSYGATRLQDIIETSLCAKGRLLHYFPSGRTPEERSAAEDDATAFSDWCGWHNDHGSLTGLLPAMYLDAAGGEVPPPDAAAGLYVRGRSGEVFKADAPEGLRDFLLFQIGEAAQIHSGGLLQATPHAVRAAAARGGGPPVSRETFAVFMEPCWQEPMAVPRGREPEDAQSSQAARALPDGVPTLASRWRPEMDFGEFTESSLKAYYGD